MTDDDVLKRLLTIAGEIMEDASAIAIMDAGDLTSGDRVATILAAADDVRSLANAARVLEQRE
jgi:hypothetical protein